MIGNKKTTSKFMSVISALVAVIMLSTTVFANGILNASTADDYTIEILNNGEKIEFANKPFIEKGEVYVPLRETLKKLGFNENNSNILWKDGKVGVSLIQSNGNAGAYCIEIGSDIISCLHESTLLDAAQLNNVIDNTYTGIDLHFNDNIPPVLRNSFTYIPIKDLNYIVYRFLNVCNEDNKPHEIIYNIYDKNGEMLFAGEDNEKMLAAADIWAKALIDRNGLLRYEIMTEDMQKQFIAGQKQIAGENWNYVIGYSSPKTVSYEIAVSGNTVYITYLQIDNTDEKYSIKEKITFEKTNGEFLVSAAEDIEYDAEVTATATKTPQYTVNCFFYLFENSDFENMKRYCTENCVNTYFNDNSVFGMEKAALAETDIAPTEYLKSSNDFNVFVSVDMIPSKISVFDPSTTSASFYVVLQRQDDGGYLIDGFSTGL